MQAPLPPNEGKRLEALKNYHILDTPPEKDLDDLTALASFICETPMALVSLVDENRQWFKSKIGVRAGETPRDVAFCAHAIMGNDLFLVPDAAKDPRFADSLLVKGEPWIRFYAGAPLITSEGYAVGTLCVMDTQPRELNDAKKEALSALARQVVAQFELRRQSEYLQKTLTEKTIYAENLEKSDIKYRSLFENSMGLICFHELDGTLRDVNMSAAASLGYTPSEMVGKNLADFLAPGVHHILQIYLESISKQGQAEGYIKLKAKSGDFKIWMYNNRLKSDTKGGKIVFGFALDVTEVKRIEKEFNESQRKYKVLVENMGDGVVQVDSDDVVRYANKQFCAMTGYKEEEIIGKKGPEIFFDENNISVQKNRHRDRMRGISERYEIQMRTKDGGSIWASVSATPLVDHHGLVEGTLGLISDITKQKEIYNALQVAEEKYRNIFEKALDGIFQSTPDGQYLSMNPAFAKIYGYASPEEMMSGVKDIQKQIYVDPQKRVELRQQLEKYGEVKNCEAEVYRKDGSRIMISENIRRVHAADAEYYEGITQDITEQKLLQKALEESEEKFRTLIESLPVGVIVAGPQGQVLLCNDAAAEMIGRTKEELVGQPLSGSSWDIIREDGSLFPPEEYPVHLAIKSKWPSRNVVMGIYKAVSEDRVWLQVDAHPMFHRYEELGQVICSFSNITHLKKTEQALRDTIHQVKTLSGLLPICASCKKIRDDQGYWHQIENYISKHSDVDFSHGICKECATKLYPELYTDDPPAE